MIQQPSRIALVTGASRGIGAAIAERLAADGFTVVLNYAGAADAAETVAHRIERTGGRALTAQADISDPDAVRGMVERILSGLGGIDVVVHNAGILNQSPIENTSDTDFDRLIAVNLKGAFNVMREAARHVRDGGRIITLSSSMVKLLHPTYGAYAATKAAVEALTGVLSREMRGRHVTVNAVAPGPTATDLFLDGKSPALIDQLARLSPLERLGTPEDIAAAVAFLAGPDGAWINGQTLRANGGMI